MLPGVPGTAICRNAATAELFRNLSKGHIEVSTPEFDLVIADVLGMSVPPIVPSFSPFDPHGKVIPMGSHDDDLSPKMANVLFGRVLHDHRPRPRHFGYTMFRVWMVLMELVKEAFQCERGILASCS